jgi:hypothetical protein
MNLPVPGFERETALAALSLGYRRLSSGHYDKPKLLNEQLKYSYTRVQPGVR